MFFFFLNFKEDNSNLPKIPSLESIRREWVDEKGEWYFAIADVIEVLTDSSNPKQYIKKMRSRDSELNLKWGTICTPVVMVAADGKLRKIQAANIEGILRIVQSIPSPNAEPLKAWLAETGADYVSDIEAAQLLAEETDKRLAARNDVRSHNKTLADAVHAAGVKTNLDYAKFHNSGYRGLYNGEDATGIKRRKKLKKDEDILDNMGSEELGANLFRITQTEAKIKRDRINSKEAANKTHFEVGRTVRKTIENLGGTMPEKLPLPAESIKKVERKQKLLKSPKNKG
jgi:DNA-damage-inducible protein D